MATKLKKMKLTSVDLVRAGANQEADICLFKSDTQPEATGLPTEAETNIFKRFIDWMRKNPTEAENEPHSHIEKGKETPDIEYVYKSALAESLHSIMQDDTLTEIEKKEMTEESLHQYAEKIRELEDAEEDYGGGDDFDKDDYPDYDAVEDDTIDEIEEIGVTKYNHNHDERGRFSSGPGGGSGSGSASGGSGEIVFTHGDGSRKHAKIVDKLPEKTGRFSNGYSEAGRTKGKDGKTYDLYSDNDAHDDFSYFALESKPSNPKGTGIGKPSAASAGAGRTSGYHNRIQSADSLDALNQIVEDAANDDSITNDEYEKIYATALERVQTWQTTSKSIGNIDIIEEVAKFNPFHDELGRFSTADRGVSFTFRTKDPAKQHWAVMAAAREAERTKDWKTEPKKKPVGPEGDPETIGGAKRGEPMTREQANEGRVNPHYGEGSGYRRNCQTCVLAFEARLRGYDVEATAKNTNNKKQVALAKEQSSAWIDPATGKHPEMIYNDVKKVKTSKQTEKWLEENIEAGGRYTFAHGWKGTSGFCGHIVSVDRASDGSLRIYDPQSGKTYTGDKVKEYLSRVKMTCSQKDVWGHSKGLEPRGKLLRVDNLRIDESVANAVLRRK